MPTSSLFPLLLKAEAGGGGGGTVLVDGFEVKLMAEPDITLDDDISITLESGEVEVTVDSDIEVEVE